MTTAAGSPGASRYRWLIGFGLVLHLAFALFVNRPGYISWDAGTYHLMVKTFAETGDFVVENGYEESPSPELIVAQLKAPQGRLVAQYPETYTLMALPAYLLMGFPGLVFLNALFFAATALLLYRLALRLFGDPSIAALALAIYALATYAWEWSHSSYPHISSTFFLMLAAYGVSALLFDDARKDEPRRAAPDPKAWLPALGAGLAIGVAVGLRLDAIFLAPALAVALLLATPVRWRALAAYGVGLLPGFLLLSFTNHHKFGTYNPLSYGESQAKGYSSDFTYYLPAVAAGLLFAGALLFLRWRFADRTDRLTELVAARWRLGLGIAVAAAGLLYALAPELVGRLVHGSYQILVDLRVRDLKAEPALTRSPGGAMIYMGGVKKALLQSCPWLALLPVALPLIARGHTDRWRLAWLAWLCLPFLAVFGSLAWHGSVALNMRYLNPVLPWLALLAAWLWHHLPMRPSPRAAWGLIAASFALAAFIVGTTRRLAGLELVHLSLPLALAAALFCSDLAGRIWRLDSLRRVAARLFLVSLALSSALVFFGDYPITARYRDHFTQLSRYFEPHVQPPAILFTDTADSMWRLLDQHDDLILARPGNDQYRTMPALVHFHLDAGRSAYLHVSSFMVPPLTRLLSQNHIGMERLTETPQIDDLPPGVFVKLVRVE